MKRKYKMPSFKFFVKPLASFAGVLLVVYGVLVVKDIEVDTVLPIKQVNVSGELMFINKDNIQSIVESNIAGGFFTIDLNSVREILLQKPWVKNVSLRKQWPDGVNVFVEERSPIAYWNNDSYISANGVVFKPALIDKNLNLPALNGPQGQHNNVWKFMNVLYKEISLLKHAVTSLTLDERRAWQLNITANSNYVAMTGEQGIKVRLGRFDTEKRLQRFLRILPALTSKKEFSKNKIKVIDMRYPNGFAVRTATDEA